MRLTLGLWAKRGTVSGNVGGLTVSVYAKMHSPTCCKSCHLHVLHRGRQAARRHLSRSVPPKRQGKKGDEDACQREEDWEGDELRSLGRSQKEAPFKGKSYLSLALPIVTLTPFPGARTSELIHWSWHPVPISPHEEETSAKAQSALPREPL